MDIQDLGAIGELVSSFAVLITLIYVAVQLRETKSSLAAQAYQTRKIAQQDALLRVAENNDLATLLSKIAAAGSKFDFDLVSLESLTDVERRRIVSFHQALSLRHDNTAFQYESGYISEKDTDLLMGALPLLLPLWEKLGIRLNPALHRYVDAKHLAT